MVEKFANKIFLLSISFLVFFKVSPLKAQQGNHNFESFGNRSLLLSGNVTGTVEDLGLTYYNPARLALIENPAFAISAKGYQWEKVKLEERGEEKRELKDNNFGSIPSMAAGTFKIKQLPKDKFAYALISRYNTKNNLSFNNELQLKDVVDEFDGEELFQGGINIKSNLKDEWIGGSWAREISKDFSIGISAFGSVYNYSGENREEYNALAENGQTINYNRFVSFNQKNYGLFFMLGTAWQNEKWSVGLNIQSPFANIHQEGKFVYNEHLSGLENGLFTRNDQNDLKSVRKTPWHIKLGAGYAIKKHKLHANISWHSAVKNYDKLNIRPLESQSGAAVPELEFQEKYKSVFNFGAGAEFFISEKYEFFCSFTSDFSAFDKSANIFDLSNQDGNDINPKLNYWHYAMGINMNLKWVKLVLGGSYARAIDKTPNTIDFPDLENENLNSAKLTFERIRLIFAIEIPFFDKKLNDLKSK